MPTNRRGSALLAVLWLVAALSAITFTVARTVRAETERTSTDVDSLRAYYIATGAIDRALLYIEWGPIFRNQDGTPKYFQNPMPAMQFNFPAGQASVEVIPDSAKLSVNVAPPAELARLVAALGVDPDRAQALVRGIVDWRSASPGGAFTEFDQHYLALTPSFRSRHASFQETEELLLIQGVTQDLFYGSYTREQTGRLAPRLGLRDCLSVFGSSGPVDVNTAPLPVLLAIGVNPDAAEAISAQRKLAPFRLPQDLAAYRDGGPGMARLGIVPSSMATLRATARLRAANGQLSDLRRTVSALIKFLPPEWNPPFHIMRWYDNATSAQ